MEDQSIKLHTMEKYFINIANNYSKTPGGRWKDLGPFSGEQFYEEMLLPRFDEAVKNGDKLHIQLDGVASYPYSFLDQSFGELGRNRGKQAAKEHIVFHTTVNQWVVKIILDELWCEK